MNSNFYPDGIPEQLRKLGTFWCLWTRKSIVDENGIEKIDKAPFSAKYLSHASVNNRQHFCSYEEAVEAGKIYTEDSWGLGICLGFDEILRTGLVCIDIDDCVNLEEGRVQIVGNTIISAEEVNEIIQRFHSYTEISPSGTGIHIFAKCKVIDKSWKKNGIEVYYTKRFIRMSGAYMSADYADMRDSDASEDAAWLKNQYNSKNKDKSSGSGIVVKRNEGLVSDDTVVSEAKTKLVAWFGKHNIKFTELAGSTDFPVRIAVDCPWAKNHTTDDNESDSAVLITSKGFYIYRCLHAHCADKNWVDYVRFYDKDTSYNLSWNIQETKVWQLKDPKDFLKVFGSVNPIGDYTDKGQSNLFCKIFGGIVAYLDTAEWVCYDGQKWRFYNSRENVLVSGLSQKLTDIQMLEAVQEYTSCKHEVEELEKNKAADEVKVVAEKKLKYAEDYLKYTKGRRAKDKLAATVTVSQPQCVCSINNFDSNPYLINTPGGVVDVKNNSVVEHSPALMLSKLTANSVVDKVPECQKKMWNDFLDKITGSDTDLKEYLQLVFGSAIVGKVYGEYLYIAYGSGGNGKSTLCNSIAAVLGDYAGHLDADYFNAESRHNQLPQLAELRGKRLVIAAETSEGTMLDSAAVKRIASTDCIHAEAKYKTPFDFYPTHTVILYTSMLPIVKGVDQGIWDRLILIPFETRIRNTESEIKNYADVLRNECGEEILSWCIEGSKKFLAAGGKIQLPKIVQEAVRKLRRANSTADCFFEDCCYYRKGDSIQASKLYDEYKKYCKDEDNIVTSRDFKVVAARYGYKHKKTKAANVFKDVALR